MTCHDRLEQLQKEDAERKKFEEWQRLNANADASFEKYVKENKCKPCPYCKYVIERTEGCDHMHCLRCNCHFCYICGKWDSTNPKRKEGCCGVRCQRR